MAIKAAIRNVLSPNSEIMIIAKEKMKEWRGFETSPEGVLVSDPSKSNMECSGENNPSSSESYAQSQGLFATELRKEYVRRLPRLVLLDMIIELYQL